MRAGLDAGANAIDSVDLETSELRKYRDEARTKALKIAREKAELLANTLSCKLGKPLMISEGYSDTAYATRSNYTGLAAQSAAFVHGAEMPAGSEAETGIALGRLRIGSNMTATFELQ